MLFEIKTFQFFKMWTHFVLIFSPIFGSCILEFIQTQRLGIMRGYGNHSKRLCLLRILNQYSVIVKHSHIAQAGAIHKARKFSNIVTFCIFKCLTELVAGLSGVLCVGNPHSRYSIAQKFYSYLHNVACKSKCYVTLYAYMHICQLFQRSIFPFGFIHRRPLPPPLSFHLDCVDTFWL